MKQVTNFQLLTFLLVFCTSFLSAQTDWTGGGGDTAWDNPLNWTAGVPDATDHVTIPVGATVVISTPALAKSIVNQGDLTIQINSSLTIEGSTAYGIDNYGSVNNAGDIHIDNAGNRGILNRTNSNFTNSNNIFIGQNGGPGNITYDGIINYSVFKNNGQLTIDNVGEQGLSNWVGGDFTNTGTINIGQNGGSGNISQNGIANGYGGVANFTNTNGRINIDNTGHSAFASFSSGLVQNLAGGQMNFGINSGNIGHHGIYNSESTFNNDASQIKIANTLSQDGLENRSGGTFNNRNGATLNIGQAGGPANVRAYGILNDANFNHSGGIINIDNTLFSAIRNRSGTFTNSAELNISQNSGPGNNVNGIFNQATFIHSGGVINIDNSQFQGILNQTSSATFTNSSIINIGLNVGNIGANGIYQSDGSFTNDGGAINIDNTGTNGILNSNGTFDNSATINIGMNAGNIGHSGIYQPGASSFFTNDGGTINIDNVNLFEGIHISGSTFENKNNGQIFIGQVDGVGRHGLYAINATFINNGGLIIIDNTGSTGISNINGTFDNFAIINIGYNAGNIGYVGLSNQALGTFNNNAGFINIDNTGADGLYNVSGSFTNTATINIGLSGGAGSITADGVENNATFNNNSGGVINIQNTGEQGLENWVTFNNNPGAIINVDNTALDGVHNPTGTLTNHAIIHVGQIAGNIGTHGIWNKATFQNNSCASLIIAAPLNNTDAFTNDGLFSVNTVNAHTNTGTVTNNGIIEMVQLPLIPNVINNEVVITPTVFNVCDEFNPAFDLGPIVDFTIVGVFVDANATMAAGTYDVNTNTFTPTGNLAEGTYNYFVKITDPNGPCDRVVSWMLVIDDVTPPTFTCPGNQVVNTNSGACLGTVPDLVALINDEADDCGTVTLSQDVPANSNFGNSDGDQINVTITADDGNGNQNAIPCVVTLTLNDHENPVPTCHNPTVQLGANGQYVLTAADVFNGGTDNCGTVTFVSANPATVDCSQAEQIVAVTVTATDGNGNQGTCTAQVTVDDDTPPVITCDNATVQLAANGEVTITPATIFTGSSDNCGFVGLQPLAQTFYDCSHVGPNTVTLNGFDGNGNTTSCTATVTVEDNISPAANCVSQTIQATLDANAQYTVDPNQLNENSTDACGIQSLVASPSVLDCQHEGTNTITLTVTDNNGNTGSCTATIEVAEWLTLDPPVTTAESCAGMGDGSILLTASAGGGQVGYSIDGGVSFQFTGGFQSLTPGTYNVVVKVFGVPAVCEKTATATVVAGPQPTTWYKDLDDDGYTDYVTQTGCTQPAGYKTMAALNGPEEDCDDNKATWFPGQVWYPDYDVDFYGTAPAVVQCSRPAGHRRADNLIEVDTDCDNNNAAIHPGAVEICNGIDDDCDGEIDEGLSGLTYVGNVQFSSQAQLDAWPPCYSIIQGTVTINGANITDLTPLANITEITGNLSVVTNSTLASLTGLENLATVGSTLSIYYNFQLLDCCAIADLLTNGGVGGATIIFFNATGSHCNSAAAIMAACNPVPLAGGGNNVSVQACSDCIPQGLLRIYPNPASTVIQVRWSGDHVSGTVQLTDLPGRVLLEQDLQSLNRFHVSQMNPGIYYVRVKADGYKQQVERVVVDR